LKEIDNTSTQKDLEFLDSPSYKGDPKIMNNKICGCQCWGWKDAD
jgi:hypothetical protein